MSTKKQVQFKQKNAQVQEPAKPAQPAADVDQLEQDIAFWTIKVTFAPHTVNLQVQSHDLEVKIDQLSKQRQQAKDNKMKDLRLKLAKAKQQLKNELELNQDLSEKVSTLSMKERDQGALVRDLDSEMQSIQTKLVDYEQSTRMKEDQTKLSRAFMQIQQADVLQDLTVLALKVTEELNRAKANQSLMQGNGNK